MSAELIGWAGVVVGVAGLIAYFVIVLRQPKSVRMLNGAGLLLTSLALFPARMFTAVGKGPFAFAIDASLVLMILAVAAQALAGWRNRTAWDGVDRRKPRDWDGRDRRTRAGGEERA